MNCGAVGCTFLWSIENYSYCPQKVGEKLISPEFSVDGLEGTAWTVQLYPRGFTDKQRGYVSLFLTRNKGDAGPEEFPLKFELSVLAANGSAFERRQIEYTFIKNSGHGYEKFRLRDEVLSLRKSNYLPQDTLSVRCKMWKGEVSLQSLTIIHARTRIGVEWIMFLHEAESFSSLDFNQKKTVHIKSPSIKGRALTSSLCFSDCACCPEKLMLKITPCDTKHILSHCKVSLLDGSGKKVECDEIDNRLDATGKNIRKLERKNMSLTRTDILSRKNEYLPDDKLSLICECSFSTGVDFEKIESFTSGVDYEKIEKSELAKSCVLLSHKWADKAAGKLSLCCGMAILKCLFVAIIAWVFGVCLSYLW